MRVTLIGVGSGTSAHITREADDALSSSDIIIGAERLIWSLPEKYTADRLAAVDTKEIAEKLKTSGRELAAVVFSGDSGFYSGARRLLPLLKENGYEVSILPGISSVQILSAKLGRPWQEWKLVSAHGLKCDVTGEIMTGRPVLFLTGGAVTPGTICKELLSAGLGHIRVTVGESLGLSGEKIITDSAAAIADMEFSPLNIVLVDAVPVMPKRTPGWPDEVFIRGEVPMTKQLVRSAILSKLAALPEDICWDIGAGTGSVSVELAAVSRHVYAVDCDTAACELIRKNREKFNSWNLSILSGTAPEILCELPAPDAVFIGGTKGRIDRIIEAVLSKNPKARLCISAIALETLDSTVSALRQRGLDYNVTQVSVSETKSVGDYHMLSANNPIFLITVNL